MNNPTLLWALVLATGAVGLAALVLGARWSARHALNVLLRCDVVENGGDTLVVLAHGYRGTIKWMAGVHAVIAEARPDADVLLFQYPAHALSNADEFIINGRKTDSTELFTQNRSPLIEYSSRLCWAVWLILIGLIVGGGWLCLYLGLWIYPDPSAGVAAVGIYAWVILLVLKNF